MEVITGKPFYVNREIREFLSRGYVIANCNKWSDGTISVKLVKVM